MRVFFSFATLALSVISCSADLRWVEMLPSKAPLPRYRHAMVYDRKNGNVVLFGGTQVNVGASLGDTWIWDGSEWTQKFPTNSPLPRSSSAMAFDEARNEVVLFGGYNDGVKTVIYNDTWVWDGTNWTQKSPVVSPPMRSGHPMVYDRIRQEIVMFGGAGGPGGYLNDTWVWNGTVWSQKTPVTTPPIKYQHKMAWDRVNGNVVMFGGYPYTSGTWIWDGSNWTFFTTAHAPSNRHYHAMAFDLSLGKILLFGGFDSTNILNDCWVWDGQDWFEITPLFSDLPTQRERHAMVLDETWGQCFVFGGEDGTKWLDDTWVLGDLLGDLNHDGLVNSVDMTLLANFLAGNLMYWR